MSLPIKRKQNKIQDQHDLQTYNEINSEAKLIAVGSNESNISAQDKYNLLIPLKKDTSDIEKTDFDSQQSLKIMNNEKRFEKLKNKIEQQGSFKKSQRFLKAVCCGCRQEFNDNQNNSSDEEKQKALNEKNKNVKVNSKKLGTYLKIWKDRAQNKSNIEIIFDLLNNKLQQFDSVVIQGNMKMQFTITRDLKLVYYNTNTKSLVREDLIKSHHISNSFSDIFSENIKLTKIVATPDCSQYLLGFENGTIHVIDAQKFVSLNYQLEFEKDWDKTSVVEIYFYQKMLFVSHDNGTVNIFQKKKQVQDDLLLNGPQDFNDSQLQNDLGKYFYQYQLHNELVLEKIHIAINGKFLIGVQKIKQNLMNSKTNVNIPKNLNFSSESEQSEELDINENVYKQQAVVFNLEKQKINLQPFKKKFGEIDQEVKKLFLIAEQRLLVLSDTMDGIDLFSFNEFKIEGHMKKMHKNIILDFVLLNDQNTLVTTGNDKRVKIWDLQCQQVIQTLQVQKFIFQTLGLSNDNKYLATAGKEIVVLWYINNWQKLCTLVYPDVPNFVTSSILFSQNNIILYAKDDNTGNFIYWQLADTSLSLEFGENKIIRAMMTYDNEFMLTENQQGSTVLWNIDTRSVVKVFIENSGFKQEFNCTSDSKFIFFKIDDTQFLQFNPYKMKKENIFYCNGEISYSCINSTNTLLFISTQNKILQIFKISQNEQTNNSSKLKKLFLKNLKNKLSNLNFKKDVQLLGQFQFIQVFDKKNDVEEKEYYPTFTLSSDDSIVVISFDGVSTLVLNVSDPSNPTLIFSNNDKPNQNDQLFHFQQFYSNEDELQRVESFKNIKSFTIDHSGDQLILVDNENVVVLQLVDTQQNNQLAKIEDLIEYHKQQIQNKESQLNNNHRQGRNNKQIEKKTYNYRYQYQQIQVLDKLQKDDEFQAYYVEKESLVLTKLNNYWSLWNTRIYSKWVKILEFEGELQVVRGKNRMLIGIIDEENQIKFYSRKLLTDMSLKPEDFIQKSIYQLEINKFLIDHFYNYTLSNLNDQDREKYGKQLQTILGNGTQFEKHHILQLGKIRERHLIIHDKRFQERFDYEEQRTFINMLYPNKQKKDNNSQNKMNLKQNMKISGPLNYIFPYILTEMIKDQKNIINYIDALKKNSINPFNINILHYFTFQNQIHCMNACLEFGIKYKRDQFEKTPLAYALERKSAKAVEQILTHATDGSHQEIITSLSQEEICLLIERSPTMLVKFLEKTYIEIEESTPLFGMIRQSGIFSIQQVFFLKDKLINEIKQANQYYIDTAQQNLGKAALPIDLKAFAFKYNFTLGSNNSVDFHWALQKTTRQVVQIMYDLKSFLVVLIGSILAISTTFTMLTNDPSQENGLNGYDLRNYLYVVWEYVFQQFPAAYIPQYSSDVSIPINYSMAMPVLFPLEDDISFQMALHLITQIFISLIMMNLIIAIINNTLEKSMQNSQQEDFKELNNMIIYYEKLLFWKKKNGKPQYLHWLEYGDAEKEDEAENEEQSKLEESLEQMNQKIDNIIVDNKKDRNRIEATEKYIIRLLQMQEELNDRKKNNDDTSFIEDQLNKDYKPIITKKKY